MSASPTQPIRDRSSRFENHLLAAMPEAEFRRWAHHIELVDMELGQVITEPGVELPYAYFPVTAIVSLLYVMRNGESAEIALVGNDGLVGVTLFMGGNSSTIRAVVQSAGKGYRLPASALEAEVARGGATLRLLLLYTQSLVTQMTQTAACNKHHSLNQQFCRWLLLSGAARWAPVLWMLEAAIVLQIVLCEDAEALIVAALLVFNRLACSSRRQSTPMTSSTTITITTTPRPPLGP